MNDEKQKTKDQRVCSIKIADLLINNMEFTWHEWLLLYKKNMFFSVKLQKNSKVKTKAL